MQAQDRDGMPHAAVIATTTGLLLAALACSREASPKSAATTPTSKVPTVVRPALATRLASFELDPPARVGQPGTRAWPAIPAHPVASAEYRDGFVTVSGMPLDSVPFAALVRYPTTPAPPTGWPFTLLIHGVHNNCTTPEGEERCLSVRAFDGACPDGLRPVASAAGLAWLAEFLAARGAVAVVIDGNWLNCDGRDVALGSRVQLVLAHLKRWKAWRDSGAGPARLGSAVDLRRVALVGHSVGGEAALLAARAMLDDEAVPGVAVAALLLVAPSDFTAAALDPWRVAVVLSECDLDGTQGPGRHIAERGLQRPGAPRLLVHVGGASHNEYNAAWRDEVFWVGTPACTGGRKLPAPAMRAVLAAVAGEWLDAAWRGREPSAWLRGDAPLPADLEAWIGRAPDLRMDYAVSERQILARPASDGATAALNTDGDVERTPCEGHACDGDMDSARPMARWQWQRGGRVSWHVDHFDASGFDHIALRLVRPHQADAARELRLTLRLDDHQGKHAVALTPPIPAVPDPTQVQRTPGREHLYPGVPMTLRVPLSAFGGVDLRNLARLHVGLPKRTTQARLVVAEVEWQGAGK
jgi:hypothetical protein